METTKKNQEEKAKDELLNKREVLSEEELLEVAAGAEVSGIRCLASCINKGKSAEECTQQCKKIHPLAVW